MASSALSDGRLPWRKQHASLVVGVCLGFVLVLCSQDVLAGFRSSVPNEPDWSRPPRTLSGSGAAHDRVEGSIRQARAHGGSNSSVGTPAPSEPQASAQAHGNGIILQSSVDEEEAAAPLAAAKWEAEHDELEVRTERVMAAMILGSVAFQMSLFYLAHQQDKDMRRYAYTSIGHSISMLCSVLMFFAVYEWIHQSMRSLSQARQDLVYPVLAFFFFCLMEFIVMFCATSGKVGRPSMHASIGGCELHVTSAVLNAKTFGTAAAQMCGAAMIRGFGHLQFQAYTDFKSTPLMWAVVLFAALMLAGAMKLMAIVRRCFAGAHIGDVRRQRWAQVAEDCENEVFAFSVGFLLAVAARCDITESFPVLLLEGFAHAHYLEVATMTTIVTLWIVAVGFAVLCVTINIATYSCSGDATVDIDSMESRPIRRFVVLLIMTSGFAFSWCGGFGLHLYAVQFGHGLKLRLGLALFTSIVSFVVIKLLDMLADLDCTGPAFDKGIVMLINALGVAIGLSWGNAFHECVAVCVDFMVKDENVIFQASDDPKVWAFALSSIIVLTVLPAYRMFIVPTMYRLLEEYEDLLALQEIEDYDQQQATAQYSAAQTQELTEQTFAFNACPSQANDVTPYSTPTPLTSVDVVQGNGR